MQCYKYRFKTNIKINGESDSILTRKLYTFDSSNTNQTYWVYVDECVHNICVIKFHLKNHRNSKYKYNLLTNLGEARSVVYTCLNLLINEFHYKNRYTSFGFIASNKKDEDYRNTKRLRFYKRFITTFIGSKTFAHYEYIDKSAYILIPHIAVDNNPNLPIEYFKMLQEHNFIEY